LEPKLEDVWGRVDGEEASLVTAGVGLGAAGFWGEAPRLELAPNESDPLAR
jgi:hypothetical protein